LTESQVRRAETAVRLLDRVVAGEVEADAALVSWTNIDEEPDDLLAAAWHQLHHYANDVDLRRDAKYENLQKAALSRSIAKIRQKYGLG
jgi:hypothetical protein